MRWIFLYILLILPLLAVFPASASDWKCSEGYARLLENRFYRNYGLKMDLMESGLRDRWEYEEFLEGSDEVIADVERQVRQRIKNGEDPIELNEQLAATKRMFQEEREQYGQLLARESQDRSILTERINSLRKQIQASPLLSPASSSAMAERAFLLDKLINGQEALFQLTKKSKKDFGYRALSKKELSEFTDELAALRAALSKSERVAELSWRQRALLPPKEYRAVLAELWQHARDSAHGGNMEFENGTSFANSLGFRFREGEHNAKISKELGFRYYKPARGQAPELAFPDDFFDYAARIVNRVENLKANGVKEEDLLYPSLYFLPKNDSDGLHPVMVRMGVDAWPDPNKYAVVHQMPEFGMEEWAGFMAEGKFPISPGAGMFLHDSAHWSELYDSPDLMIQTRRTFARVNRLPKQDQKEYFIGNARGRLDKSRNPARALGQRVYAFQEFFDLPDVSKRATIFEQFPEIKSLSAAAAGNWRERLKEISRESADKIRERAERWAKKGRALIRRQGGGMRDGYNFDAREKPGKSIWEAYQKKAGRKVEAEEDLGKDRKINSEISQGTLSKAQWELELLVKLRYEPNNELAYQELSPIKVDSFIEQLSKKEEVLPDTLSPLNDPVSVRNRIFDELIRERMARLETGFRAGLDVGITPARVVEDSSQMLIDESSPTYRCLNAYQEEGTFVWEAFLSPVATGQQRLRP